MPDTSDTSATHPLASLLTPDFLTSIARSHLPPDKSKHHNLSLEWIQAGPNFDSEETKAAWWTALVTISRIPLSEMPDMMSFLPPPADPAFPEQSLGLTLLLDQGPRLLCRGADGRWTDGFFGQVSQQLAHSWLALPAEQQPNAWKRWEEAGASFEHWCLLHLFLSCPFVHSERLEDQDIALEMTEERRKGAEQRSGETDPYREKRSEVLSDALAFPRVIRAGPPAGEDVTMQEWVFWSCMLFDVHWPIIKKFGKYPYRNAVLGRESTEEEVKWLEETKHFAEASPEVAERVEKDIKANRWTALKDEVPA
ncbi:hypothetical protein CORC01_05322 [Colletotrichum orchidophilum]|uniref:Uncharacterized protein n=1 Tax=Colletotrichum orchidophilum TaxID=1209926 RepID=A0A1G4BD17_9PEZI|nr:uncharacterized protein CORC01_05322 [Colletotrichum orchidophilum]OHE99281.1 hypothetical protein CORC01_05322 [Colletotrichum orchidophilum]